MLVAEDDGDICGSVIVLFRALSRKARLYSIAARSGTSGVGRALLAAAEECGALARRDLDAAGSA